jgi:hypothetical protein
VSFGITINGDGTVLWHGVETGKTKVLAKDEKIVVLHTAGHNYQSGRDTLYAPATITVHEYDPTGCADIINLRGLFGLIEWETSSKWRPE